MEILDLRHFSSADLRPLLDQESQVWSHKLSWDYSGSAEMILRYVDAKILPGYAAVERGTIHGYSFFVYEGGKGVIGDLYAERGNGNRRMLETELVSHVIATLQQSPGIHRIEAQLLTHEAGELATPFVAEGFHCHPRLFMTLPMTTVIQRRRSAPAQVEIAPWREEDYQATASVISAAYAGHIDAEINDQYRSVNGSLRFLNNIIRFPGCGVFDPGGSFVARSRNSKTLLGVLLCSRVKEDVGHITQVCIVPEARGQGIGEALIAASVGALQKRSFRMLSLTVTEANWRAVELYQRLGFQREGVFDAFVWEG